MAPVTAENGYLIKYFRFEVFQCLKMMQKCLASKKEEDIMERSYKKI